MFLTKKLKSNLISKFLFSLLIFSVCFFCGAGSSIARDASKEREQDKDALENHLPTPPETGSPEDDFSAGGTRDNYQQVSFCGAKNQQISFLLGAKSRETTVSPYPSFWFYFPEDLEPIIQMEFLLIELKTNREIYRSLKTTAQKGIVGIKLPRGKNNALSPQMNYRWELSVSCQESIYGLDGWINFVPMDSDLQQKLALVSQEEKFKTYWQENLIYDAFNNLAHIKVQKNSPHLEQAWRQMLHDLGWQELGQISSTQPTLW